MQIFFEIRNETGLVKVDGSSVLKARSAARLTQAEVADRMEVLGYYLPQPYVSNLENHRYPWGFSERMATALAATLGVGVTEITGGRLLTKADIDQARGLISQLDEMIEPVGEAELSLVAA